MITDSIQEQITKAMKEKDEVRLSTLKLLSSELHNAKIAKIADLTKEEEITVVKREASKRRDAIEAYEKAGAKDRAEKEKQELAILNEFLPEQMSEEEVKKLVNEVITQTGAKEIKEMGKVMGQVMAKSKGQADGKIVSLLVKEMLSR